MKLVVGLGNPGAQYHRTRHNVGFEVIQELARRHGLGPFKAMMKAEVSRGRVLGEEILLVQPMTYMNLSGDAVGALMRYFKGEPRDVIVVHDELDFEPGIVRIKNGGGHGGHNGVRSVIGHIGREFPRVRVGVGKPPRGGKSGEGADHVLSPFNQKERVLIDEAVHLAADAVEGLLTEGLSRTMNRFNQKASATGSNGPVAEH